MKRFFKFLLMAIVLFLVILIAGAAIIQFSGLPEYEPGKVKFQVTATPNRVAEGARLSSMLCSGCHMGADNALSGRLMSEAPPEFGTVYSANITQHRENGIGSWTDSEIAYFLRTGVKRDGRFAPVYMPRFVNLSDDDLQNVIAYLRSDRKEVQSVDLKQQVSQPSFLVKFLCRVAWKPIHYPATVIEKPDTGNPIAYGKYLVTGRYDCYPCHSADFTKIDFVNPELSAGFMGGGNKLLDMAGKEIYSANLTPHPETGIGAWDYEQFKNALVYGKLPSGGVVRYPMFPYAALNESETQAIFAYLKQIPSLNHPVNRGTR